MKNKIISVFIAIFFSVIFFNINEVFGIGIISQCWKYDVNGDGKVNVGDANLVYKHALQTKLITDEYTLLCSNVNGDARVNVGDANLIYKHALQTKKLW